ncbi:unnamed protein product [Phytophthora fragariaefolia]|uniref:Unnamed protein product n=1 Tax=Phytophthora fragariaefolia TaxID=1490495 RepID=A0A9W6XUZ0_9STRA|nr:unnamed protein product [Phytophthora fragariaefolia]
MPPSQPTPAKAAKRFERSQAKARVVRAYKEGRNWQEVARNNDIHYSTACRAVLAADEETKDHGGLRAPNVKLTVEAMCKLEEYIEEDCRRTLADLRDLLFSDLGISVGKSSIHRALQGMLYSVKRVRIEKATMNSPTKPSARSSSKSSTNTSMQRAVVALPPSQGKNLHVQGGVSSGTGIVLLKTHEGSVKKEENARFLADLFMAALRTDEFQELEPNQKIVIVTDNAPAHSGVESLARRMLAEDGVVNFYRLEILRLGPYSPMLNPIEGCWNSLKARMKKHLADRKEEMMVRGDYDTYKEHRLAIMKEAVETSKGVITRRLVWRFERHCLRLCFVAEREEDMKLGA